MARTRSFALATAVALSLLVAACGTEGSPSVEVPEASSTTTQATAGPEGPTITMKSFAFEPAELRVHVGDTVTVSNEDAATHTWTADDGSFDSGELAPGATKTQVFSAAGTVAYHCEIHTSMQGKVVVEA